MQFSSQIIGFIVVTLFTCPQASFAQLLNYNNILPDSAWLDRQRTRLDSSEWKQKLLDQAEYKLREATEKNIPPEVKSELEILQANPMGQLGTLPDLSVNSILENGSDSGFGQFGSIGLIAFNHFSGKEEILQNAFSTFSELKRKKDKVQSFLKSSDSIRRNKRPAFTQFYAGLSRPVSSGFALDLYPGVGFIWPSGWGIQLGYTHRISWNNNLASLSGYRVATVYYLTHGVSIQIDGERLRLANNESFTYRLHLVGSIRKTIPIAGLLYSFIQLAYDFGRPIQQEGYGARYNYRAGVEYRLKTGKRRTAF